MPTVCARCGAAEAPYFAEIPNVAMGSHNTVWLCKQHARELAEIVREYQQGRTITSSFKYGEGSDGWRRAGL